jgi:hypothetical protein
VREGGSDGGLSENCPLFVIREEEKEEKEKNKRRI